MPKEKAIDIWNNKWSEETHKTEYAKKRIISAQSAKLTPIKIDDNDFYGYFQGSSGKYETFLDTCPCGDFRRSKLPCKHIYRLAIELGLINIEFKSNVSAIPTPKNEQATLSETIDIIEKLSNEAQHLLLEIASVIRSTNPTTLCKPSDILTELLNNGIVSDTKPGDYTIEFGKKSEIIELLELNNVDYDKKAKKMELEKLCIERIKEQAANKFEKRLIITIPTTYKPVKIHYYLHRKFEYEYYIDENMNEYSVPLLETELPDDDVTEQLIKRGYYSRK